MSLSDTLAAEARRTADDPRWARIQARDKSADGAFWYAVATTGIYCRPSCPSRTARPENVTIVDTQAAARALAARNGSVLGAESFCMPIHGFRSTRGKSSGETWRHTTEAQRRARPRWFANLNTPEEFAEAERHLDVLDT